MLYKLGNFLQIFLFFNCRCQVILSDNVVEWTLADQLAGFGNSVAFNLRLVDDVADGRQPSARSLQIKILEHCIMFFCTKKSYIFLNAKSVLVVFRPLF
jgi:hypothetical protein